MSKYFHQCLKFKFQINMRKIFEEKYIEGNGTNCRVYGVKLFTKSEGDESLPSEIFLEKKLQLNYPRLSNYDATFLLRRAEILLR
jgi:hypothetical protein